MWIKFSYAMRKASVSCFEAMKIDPEFMHQ